MEIDPLATRSEYPILSGLTSIHVTPEGAWMATKEMVRLDRTKMVDSPVDRLISFYPALPVNKSARDFLLLCDGNNSYTNILKSLALQYRVSTTRVMECIQPFYSKAIELSHIETVVEPHPHAISITGRNDIYLPVHLQFELTDECNMFCNYCYRNAKYVQDASFSRSAVSSQSFTEVEAVYKRCIANGVRAIELSGGEPMMSEHFKNVIKLLGRHGILVAVETNGTLIDDEIADLLSSCGNVMLSVSLDGHNEEINRKISHCPGGFQRTIDGVKRLAERKIVFRIAATACPENIDHLEELLLLSQEVGAVQFGCVMPMSFGRQKVVEKQEGEESVNTLGCRFNAVWNQLIEKYPTFIAQFNESTWNYHQQVGNCGVGHRSFGVDPEGNVRICTVNTAKWSQIGNLYTDPYEQIFSNPLVTFFRNLRAPAYDVCGECPQLLTNCSNCVMRGIDMYLTRREQVEQCQWAQAFNIDEALGYISIKESSRGGCVRIEARR